MSIRYGFFNAKRTDDGFDRLYSNEDMNDFLRGVISQNGVFAAVGDQCMVDYPMDVYPTSEYNSIVVHAGQVPGVAEGSIMLRVRPGKALVNGHWVYIDSDEEIYLTRPPLTSDGRIDMISIRWNELDRKCVIYVTQGNGNYYPQPMGNRNGVFDASSGVVDIVLAYVHVPSGIPGPSSAGDIRIESMVGKNVCPYISHLVQGASTEDVDRTLSSYYARFDEWFATIERTKDLNLHIAHREATIFGIPKTIPLNNETFTDYSYDTSDVIMVYINGMIVTEGTYYQILNNGSDWYIEIIASIFGDSDVVEGNEIKINVIRATSLELPPDGDEIAY